MKNMSIQYGIVALMLLLMPCAAVQASVIYGAVLTGAAGSPPTASPGTGTTTVEYDSVLHTMKVDVLFSGLIGTTTAAHIHCCVAFPGHGNAGVATTTPTFTGFPSGVSSGTYSHLFDLSQASSFNASFLAANGGTTASAEAALAGGLASGSAYFNMHTDHFPGGEIRGFLTAVPLPTAAWLLGSGLLGLVGVGRCKAV